MSEAYEGAARHFQFCDAPNTAKTPVHQAVQRINIVFNTHDNYDVSNLLKFIFFNEATLGLNGLRRL
jgi:hypothetical protein